MSSDPFRRRAGRPTHIYDLGDLSVSSDQLRILAAYAWEGAASYYQLTKKFKMRRNYDDLHRLEGQGLLLATGTNYQLTKKGFVRLVNSFQFAERPYLPSKLAIDLKSKEGVSRFFTEGKSARAFLPRVCTKLKLIEALVWGTQRRTEWMNPLYHEILHCFAENGTDGEKFNFDWDDALFRHLSNFVYRISHGNPDLLDPFLADPDFRRYLLEDYETEVRNSEKIKHKFELVKEKN